MILQTWLSAMRIVARNWRPKFGEDTGFRISVKV